MPMLLLVKNTTKRYNILNVNDLGGGIAPQIIRSNLFRLRSVQACSKTYLGAFARHLVGLLCLCVLKTES